MTITITAKNAMTALSNHRSQFSKLNPISPISRISSGCRESSSHTPVRVASRNAPYAPTTVRIAQNEKSAIEKSL